MEYTITFTKGGGNGAKQRHINIVAKDKDEAITLFNKSLKYELASKIINARAERMSKDEQELEFSKYQIVTVTENLK
jgi:hypothetical protein